jgi:hypothetical protein
MRALAHLLVSREQRPAPFPDPAPNGTPAPAIEHAEGESAPVRTAFHDTVLGEHMLWHDDVPLTIRLTPPLIDPAAPVFANLMTPPGATMDLRDRVHDVLAEDNDPIAQASVAERHISRVSSNTPSSLPDAENAVLPMTPTGNTETGACVTPPGNSEGYDAAVLPGPERHALVAGGPSLPRDRAALLEIARYRILGFRDLNAQVFKGRRHPVISRRMKELTTSGYLTTWEQRLVVGGRPRYALLTAKGLAWALAELAAEAEGKPHEKLVRFMIGDRAKKPLVLAPGSAPNFLPHQLETNRLVAALERVPSLGIVWASTWHRPLPNEIDKEDMPQPDAVLVAIHNGEPHLIFLEHDRNAESPASFVRKKTDRFSLFRDYEFAEELFGIRNFTVWVTVTDPVDHKPMERLRVLREASRDAPMMLFTLAGWAHGHAPADIPIWFNNRVQPRNDGLHPEEHQGLVGPFTAPIDEANLPLLTRMRRSTRDYRRREPAREPDPFASDDYDEMLA